VKIRSGELQDLDLVKIKERIERLA